MNVRSPSTLLPTDYKGCCYNIGSISHQVSNLPLAGAFNYLINTYIHYSITETIGFIIIGLFIDARFHEAPASINDAKYCTD